MLCCGKGSSDSRGLRTGNSNSVARAILIQEGAGWGNAFVKRKECFRFTKHSPTIVIPRVLSAGVEKKATPPFVGWLSG